LGPSPSVVGTAQTELAHEVDELKHHLVDAAHAVGRVTGVGAKEGEEWALVLILVLLVGGAMGYVRDKNDADANGGPQVSFAHSVPDNEWVKVRLPLFPPSPSPPAVSSSFRSSFYSLPHPILAPSLLSLLFLSSLPPLPPILPSHLLSPSLSPSFPASLCPPAYLLAPTQ
jgi:hypothetical protein